MFDFAPDCGQFAAEQFDGGEACGEPGIRGAAFQLVGDGLKPVFSLLETGFLLLRVHSPFFIYGFLFLEFAVEIFPIFFEQGEPGVEFPDTAEERDKNGPFGFGMKFCLFRFGAALLTAGEFAFLPGKSCFQRGEGGGFLLEGIPGPENFRSGVVAGADGLDGLPECPDRILQFLKTFVGENLDSGAGLFQGLAFEIPGAGELVDLSGDLGIDPGSGDLLQKRRAFIGGGTEKIGKLTLRKNHRAGKMGEIHSGQTADPVAGLLELG